MSEAHTARPWHTVPFQPYRCLGLARSSRGTEAGSEQAEHSSSDICAGSSWPSSGLEAI